MFSDGHPTKMFSDGHPTKNSDIPSLCMEWKDWQHLPLKERSSLPSCSGIYVVADINDFVWYVGQAANLRSRWVAELIIDIRN